MADDAFHFRIIPLEGIEERFSIYRISRGKTAGLEKRVEIREIANQDVRDKKCIGSAMGQDILHCIYLGMKYCEDFTKKVRWYSSDPENEEFRKLKEKQPYAIYIKFYKD